MALTRVNTNSILNGTIKLADMALEGGAFANRNKIINGDMRVAQRASSYALTTTLAYGSVDRWCFLHSGTAAGIANQVTSDLTGFKNMLKLGRNSGSSVTGQIYAVQAFETVNSIPLQGKSITLSYYVKAGTNFSGGTSFTPYISIGTGTDQSSGTIGSWTGAQILYNTSHAISTTWVRYQVTVTIPSSATQIAVMFFYTPSGTAGADDNIYITGVQLEEGITATPFEHRNIQHEIALCQRYYEKSFAIGTTPAQNLGVGSGETSLMAGKAAATAQFGGIIYTVIKRAAATTITTFNPAATNAQVRDVTASVDCTSTGTTNSTDRGFRVTATGNASTAVGNILSIHWTAESEL